MSRLVFDLWSAAIAAICFAPGWWLGARFQRRSSVRIAEAKAAQFHAMGMTGWAWAADRVAEALREPGERRSDQR